MYILLVHAVPPIVCYCCASILMTVMNKVRRLRISVFKLQAVSLLHSKVRSVRKVLQHELPIAVHTVGRLRLVRCACQSARDHFVQRVRCEGRQGVVPDQLSTCQRDIHRLEKSGEYLLSFCLSRC